MAFSRVTLGAKGRLLGQSTVGGLLLLTAVSWAIYGIVGDGFLSSFNLFTLSQTASETAVIGMSQLAVIVIGRLNLAVGAVGAVVVMFTGWLIGIDGINPIVGIVLGLLLGTAGGALMGWLELITGLSSFIITLAMASIYAGIVLIQSGGAAISSMPQMVTDFGSNQLVLPSLSLLLIPAALIAVGLWYLYHRSSWGWQMLAVGANQRAAELSGVSVPRVVIASFAVSGLLAGVAGIMEMSRVASALPSLGASWLLLAFIVPILGGTSLSGGAVSLAGALVAAVFIESINSGLVSLSVSAYWQQFAQAFVLLVAVIVDQARRRRSLRRPMEAPQPTANPLKDVQHAG